MIFCIFPELSLFLRAFRIMGRSASELLGVGIVLLALLFLPGIALSAQIAQTGKSGNAGIDGFTVKTNAVDWIFTIPNLQFFDKLPEQVQQFNFIIPDFINWEGITLR